LFDSADSNRLLKVRNTGNHHRRCEEMLSGLSSACGYNIQRIPCSEATATRRT
jgi:hypothetical protein